MTPQPDPNQPQELRRPRTRGECVDGIRPCPWVSCRYHLMIHIDTYRRQVRLHTDPDDWTAETPTCALDMAEHVYQDKSLDPVDASLHMSRDQIGALMGVGRETIRQEEMAALQKIRSLSMTELLLRAYWDEPLSEPDVYAPPPPPDIGSYKHATWGAVRLTSMAERVRLRVAARIASRTLDPSEHGAVLASLDAASRKGRR